MHAHPDGVGVARSRRAGSGGPCPHVEALGRPGRSRRRRCARRRRGRRRSRTRPGTLAQADAGQQRQARGSPGQPPDQEPGQRLVVRGDPAPVPDAVDELHRRPQGALIPARSGVPPSMPVRHAQAVQPRPVRDVAASRTPLPPPGRNGASSGVDPAPDIGRHPFPRHRTSCGRRTPRSRLSSFPHIDRNVAGVSGCSRSTAGSTEPIFPRSSSSVVIDPNTWWTCVTAMSRVRGETLASDVLRVRLAGHGDRIRDQRNAPPEPGEHLRPGSPEGYTFDEWSRRAEQDLVPVDQVRSDPGHRHRVQPRPWRRAQTRSRRGSPAPMKRAVCSRIWADTPCGPLFDDG